MPPRWFCLLIVLFWLAVTGWLFWHDLLPHLLPGQPPPYGIELVEEAQTTRAEAIWTVSKDGKKVGQAKTRTEYTPHNQLYEMIAQIKPEQSAPNQPTREGLNFTAHGIRIQKMESIYRVDAAGNLSGLSVRVDGQIDLASLVGRKVEVNAFLTLEGHVESGRLSAQVHGELLGKHQPDRDLPAVPIGGGETILMPWHPVNRHRDLRPGQTWQVRLLDPLAFSPVGIGALQGLTEELPMLHARVRPAEVLFTSGRGKLPCLVIDYEGDLVKLTTWVSRKDGLILAQEAKLDTTRWELKRE